MAITVREFSKIFRGNLPREPLEPLLLFLNLLQIILPEKTTLEKMLKFGVPCSKQFLITPQTKAFSNGLFTPFSASTTVFSFTVAAQTFNLIQNCIPTPKFSGSTPGLK